MDFPFPFLACSIERQRDREKVRDKDKGNKQEERVPKMPIMAASGPGSIQVLGTQLKSPTWLAGAQLLKPSLLSLKCAFAVNWIQEQSRDSNLGISIQDMDN